MVASTKKVSVVSLILLVVAVATASGADDSSKTRPKTLYRVTQVLSKFSSAAARNFGFDDGYSDGGDGIGLGLALLALLLSGLALLAALVGPLIGLGLTAMTGTGTTGTMTGGTLSVLPMGTMGRKRRSIPHEKSVGGIENVLVMLDNAVKLYEALGPHDKKSAVCDVARHGPITNGLVTATKKFISTYEFLKNYEPGSVTDLLKKSSAASLLMSIYEQCSR